MNREVGVPFLGLIETPAESVSDGCSVGKLLFGPKERACFGADEIVAEHPRTKTCEIGGRHQQAAAGPFVAIVDRWGLA